MQIEKDKLKKVIEAWRDEPTREYVKERGRVIAATFVIEELLAEIERLEYGCMGEDL